MPPWSPDPACRDFVDQRLIPNADASIIRAWVDGGALEGDEWGFTGTFHKDNGACGLQLTDALIACPRACPVYLTAMMACAQAVAS